MHVLLPLALFALLLSACSCRSEEDAPLLEDYGVDCSFPIHRKDDWKCGAHDLGDRQSFYEEYMQGCRDYYGPKKSKSCDVTEVDRLKMSLEQPRAMVNFTSTGFKKIRAPKQVMDMLYQHWNLNKGDRKKEAWNTGNIYVNHWSSPTYMVSVEDRNLRGGGHELKNSIWKAVQPEIEQWTGMELQPTSLYGIRVYTEGAVLSPHVDRIPLVSSCIINVAQDIDEPWPLEVIDRHGRAVNVTMNPGDMVLYESHSLIHARPFPLKGRYMANVFIHFEPTGRPLSDTTNDYLESLDDFFPPYILKDTSWARRWANENPSGWHRPAPSGPKVQTTNVKDKLLHAAAAGNEVDTLLALVKSQPHLVSRPDENGWHPLHEASRADAKEAAELLIQHGADINARTGRFNDGQSVLNLALEFHDQDSEIVQYLRSLGAQDIAAEEQAEL